ncbi:MAG: acyltransferase [Bacteroides sp.]|nr:acyltransferase [Bacteroides sp.]
MLINRCLPPPVAKHTLNQSLSGERRLKEFDALRGFSMLSVVYMHVLLGAGIGSFSTISGSFIMSWFMPLFFFISGFFSFKPLCKWRYKSFPRTLFQKVKALIISAIVFYFLLSYCKGGNVLGWIHHGFKWYWFTPVLFEMYLFYMIAVSISLLLKRDISMVMMIVVTIILWIEKDCTVLNDAGWWAVVNGSALCYFIQWFVTGIIVRRYDSMVLKFLNSNIVRAMLVIGYVALMCLTLSEGISLPPFIKKLTSLAVSYFGVFLLYMLFYQGRQYFVSNNRFANMLCFTGQRTLDIYMIHYFFIPTLPIIGAWIAPNSMVLFQLLYGLCTAIVITAISLLLSWCLRTSPLLADWLFGVRPKTQIA